MLRHWPAFAMFFATAALILRLVTIFLFPEVTFILPSPQVTHAYSLGEAFRLESTFMQLGVTSSVAPHESHYHVTYECPRWTTVTVQSHEHVLTWKRWLHAMGFATNH